MAKAVAKSKKTVAKTVVKSKQSGGAKAAPAASARKTLTKAPARPVAKSVTKSVTKAPSKPASKTASKTAKKAVVSKPVVETAKAGKWVYTFGNGKAEGKAGMKNLLGGKGANLAEMATLGLPVPSGLHRSTYALHYLLPPRPDPIRRTSRRRSRRRWNMSAASSEDLRRRP